MSYDDDLNNDGRYEELMISGLIYLDPERDIAVEVRRGMNILASDGREAGKVAAVTIDRHDRQVTHIILGLLSPIPEYRRLPIDLIAQVRDESVLLRIIDDVVNNLPPWHES